MPGARGTFSRSSHRREGKRAAAGAFFPHSLVSHTFRVTSLDRESHREQAAHHAPYTRSSPCHFRRRPGRRDRRLSATREFVRVSRTQPRRASNVARTRARVSLARDTSSGASSFGVLKRPSARRGPGIVSVDRNVRSKCRCSCVLQFTS